MKHGLPCILALQLTAQLAAAAWINIGPYGGVARALASDASGTTVYVMNPRSGVFRSSGGPWILVFDAIDRRSADFASLRGDIGWFVSKR